MRGETIPVSSGVTLDNVPKSDLMNLSFRFDVYNKKTLSNAFLRK